MTPPRSDVRFESHPPGRGPAEDVLALFACLWAASVLFHVASNDAWHAWWVEVVAALWLLARPMSTVALLALATLQIGQTFPITVGTQNHALFAAFVCMAIVAGAAVVAVRGRRLTLDRAEWLRTFAPPVRWSLFGLYFFAVFHKLNRDWFDPAVSCGTEFYLRQRDVFSFLPASEWAVQGGIWGSFAVEAAIPLLLAFERSRHAGVLLGLVFHWALAANPLRAFFNFSSMLFAVFVLFLSADRVAAFADRLGRRRIHLLRGLVVVVFGVWAAAELMGPAEALPDSRAAGRIAWYVWGSVLTGLAVAVVAGRARSAGPSPALFALRHPLLALVPVLVVLNGLSPYLGLHTTANWAMFSNLRTEGGRSNHLIVPADWQLFDYQRELVRVVRSSDRYLQSSSGRLIPYFEIRRRPDAAVTYVRGASRFEFGRASEDARFSAPPPKLAAALMAFRPVSRSVKQPCVH